MLNVEIGKTISYKKISQSEKEKEKIEH